MTIKSKAALMMKANEALWVTEVDLAPPKEDEVLIQIKATGICHSDLNGLKDASMSTPTILGHEGSGIVMEVGKNVRHVKANDVVALSWLPYCGECFYCQNKQPQLCESVYQPLFDGTLLDGTTRFTHKGTQVFHYSLLSTFSEYTVVPARACIKLDKGIPFPVAAILGCGVATGYGAAVHAANIQPNTSVMVVGLGGVGISAVQGARIADASMIMGIDIKTCNLETAQSMGATHVMNAKDESLKGHILELTSGRGVDVAIDTTGNTDATRLAVELTRKGGTTVVVGAFHKPELTLPASGFHRLGKTLKGSFYGDGDPIHGFQEIVDHYLEGNLNLDALIRETIPLEQINEAFQSFEDPQKVNVGRSVVVFD